MLPYKLANAPSLSNKEFEHGAPPSRNKKMKKGKQPERGEKNLQATVKSGKWLHYSLRLQRIA